MHNAINNGYMHLQQLFLNCVMFYYGFKNKWPETYITYCIVIEIERNNLFNVSSQQLDASLHLNEPNLYLN